MRAAPVRLPRRFPSRLALMVVAAAAAACQVEAGPRTPVEPERIYAETCARCHGSDGRGDPDMAKQMPVKDLTSAEVRNRSNEDLERVIMTGRNQMPAFGNVLSPRKIQGVVGHVRRLGTGETQGKRE